MEEQEGEEIEDEKKKRKNMAKKEKGNKYMKHEAKEK
jgi:hypothetical protein